MLWTSHPLLWRVLERATVAFKKYKPLLRKPVAAAASPNVMLLADRGFANHDLMSWLQASGWYYCLRFTVRLHGVRTLSH